MIDTKEKLDTKEAAVIVGRKPKTLRDWRWKGIGPKWSQDPNKKVTYLLKDLEAWLNGKN